MGNRLIPTSAPTRLRVYYELLQVLRKNTAFYILIGVTGSIVEFFTLSTVLFPFPSALAGAVIPPLALSLFTVLSLGDAAAFGVGVALLVWANRTKWSVLIQKPASLLVISGLWFAMLGWVHNGFHLITTVDYSREVVSGQLGSAVGMVLAIDFVFHGTTIIFAALILVSVLRLGKTRNVGPLTSRARLATLLVSAVVIAAAAFLVRPFVFPANGAPPPPSWMVPLVTFLDAWDAAALGLGASFLIWTMMTWRRWGTVLGTPAFLVLGVANYTAITPWIHDGLHATIDNSLSHEIVSLQFGSTFYSLIGIEFLFHFSWLVYAVLIVVGLQRLSKIIPVPTDVLKQLGISVKPPSIRRMSDIVD